MVTDSLQLKAFLFGGSSGLVKLIWLKYNSASLLPPKITLRGLSSPSWFTE